MAGTREGGIKAAETNKRRYGSGFYQDIGAAGGKKSTGGGFAQNRELARIAGQRGGRASRRRPSGA
jgi:general stress protein YciG